MGIWEKIKRSFKSGLVIVAPMLILLMLLQVVFNTVLIAINPIVKGLGLGEKLASLLIAQVIGIIFLVALTTLIGAMRCYWPDGTSSPLSSVASVVPAINSTYKSMQKMGEALSGRGGRYERAVLVEYPRENVYHLGFVTGEAAEAEKALEEDELYSVFVPFSPNMTNGNLIFVGEDEITDLDIEVSEAVEMSLSLGVVDPEDGD